MDGGEYAIVLPSPLVQVPARGYSVCCLGRGEQLSAGNENLPVWLGPQEEASPGRAAELRK